MYEGKKEECKTNFTYNLYRFATEGYITCGEGVILCWFLKINQNQKLIGFEPIRIWSMP